MGTPSRANWARNGGLTIPPSQGPQPRDLTRVAAPRFRASAWATLLSTSLAMA